MCYIAILIDGSVMSFNNTEDFDVFIWDAHHDGFGTSERRNLVWLV